jgi:hypothetical protein
MERQHDYEKIISRKLNGLTAPDVAGLWEQMKFILDREMPQPAAAKNQGGARWPNPNLLVTAGLLLSVGGTNNLCQAPGELPGLNAVITGLAERNNEVPEKETVANTCSGLLVKNSNTAI